jgi:ribose/xylose/arabinose/galactoside ABC-type transport system permease subunit
MLQKISSLATKNQKFLPLSATVVLFFATYIFGALLFPAMRDPQVFFNLFQAGSFILISAVGMTLVIISGGIDLSVSGIVALTTVASAAMLRSSGMSPWLIMFLMLCMGMAFGAVMGFFITYLKVQPFIATLAGMWFASGMCFFISDDAIPITNRIYRILGQTKLLIPGLSDPAHKLGDYTTILVVVSMIVFVFGMYLAHFTRFGRTIYAMGGNETSARLMGLSVNTTKMLVYTLNGFCSALAGIAYSIYVMSGHGLYAKGFEMTVIAAVVIGGTMLTGGEGYIFGTLFGVLITVLIQTLILFNGTLSSWWTSIVIGILMLIFIGVQSLISAWNKRQLANQKKSRAKGRVSEQVPVARQPGILGWWMSRQPRSRQLILLACGAVIMIAIGAISMNRTPDAAGEFAASNSTATSGACQLKPFRQDQAANLMNTGAVIAYERNGGSDCIDELYVVYPDGRITLDDGLQKAEKQVASADVEKLLSDINNLSWFTEEMYSTSHTPCGQCFTYFLTVSYKGQEKTVQAVDGGTDAPAEYWKVVSTINGVIPKIDSTP